MNDSGAGPGGSRGTQYELARDRRRSGSRPNARMRSPSGVTIRMNIAPMTIGLMNRERKSPIRNQIRFGARNSRGAEAVMTRRLTDSADKTANAPGRPVHHARAASAANTIANENPNLRSDGGVTS